MAPGFLAEANETLIYRTLGTIIIAIAVVNLTRTRLEISPLRQKIFNPLVGFIAGVVGGMSTLMGPVLIPYLSSLGFAPSVFVATISFIYLIGIVTVSMALATFGIVSYSDFTLSLAAVFPVLLGMWIGAWIRERLSVDRFLFMIDLLLIGIGVSLFAKG